jgi:hypothetical protein
MRTVSWFVIATSTLLGQTTVPTLTPEQKEAFLLNATIQTVKAAKKGVTGTWRATLSDGVITHDASIQKIDQSSTRFETNRGVELNFRDCYKFNIAAWRLARMLGLESMMPPSVARRYAGTEASFTWWVDDVQMDEVERLKRKANAPDKALWSREYFVMKVFDQLIYNTDRNAQNILYDKEWHIWMIDHSRAFRIQDTLLDAKVLERCDLRLFNAMKSLTETDLNREVGPWLRNVEIKALLKRRDRIVALFENRPDKLYQFLSGPAMAQQ